MPLRTDVLGGSGLAPAQIYDYAPRPGTGVASSDGADTGAAYGYSASMRRYEPQGSEQTQGQGNHDDRAQEYGRYRRTGWDGR